MPKVRVRVRTDRALTRDLLRGAVPRVAVWFLDPDTVYCCCGKLLPVVY